MARNLALAPPEADFARLRSYLFCLLGDRDLAEDILQETLLRYLSSGRDGKERNVQAWLMRCARNLAFNERRAQLRRRQREEEHHRRHGADGTALESPSFEDRDRLEECLGLLGGPLAELIWLKFVDGRSLREIEELVGQPRSTVALRVQEALVFLHLCIEKELS